MRCSCMFLCFTFLPRITVRKMNRVRIRQVLSTHLAQPHKSCLYCYFQMVPYWNVASSIKPEGSTNNLKMKKASQASGLTQCRQHKCDLCSKTFLHRSNMLRHNKEEHLGIFNHRCQICKKGFSNKGDLEGHLVSHGAQRHACTSCGKSYAYRNDLRKHMMNSH